MMKRNQRRTTTFLLAALGAVLLLTAGPAPVQATFEELSISPRSRGMGETVVAVPGDAWSFNHNPALLSLLDRARFSSSTVRPNGLNDFQLRGLGIAVPVPEGRGGAAFGYRHWSVDRGTVNLTREQTLTFAHGFSLFGDATSTAHFGWAVNFYNLEFAPSVDGLDPGSAWSYGIDAGAMVTIYERTRVGFFTRNLNSPTIGIDQEELRQMVAAGIAYSPYEGVVTAFDIRSQLGEEFRFHGGVELGITEVLDLRMGIESDPGKLTGGFGIHLPRYFTFDYGFSTGGGTLDSSHQFGLSVRLGDGGSGK